MIYKKSNFCLGLFAPASCLAELEIKKILTMLDSKNIPYVCGKNVWRKQHYLAGSKQERLADIIDLLENEKVTHLWALRGGYGCTHLIESLQQYLRENRIFKPILGFSDITVLHLLFQKKFPKGLGLYHGPNLINFILPEQNFDLDSILEEFSMEPKLVKKKQFDLTLEYLPKLKEKTPSLKIDGPVFAGNLTLFSHLVGSSIEANLNGKILILEDWNEAPYRIDRMLYQLSRSKYFGRLRALILGDFTRCETAGFGWPEIISVTKELCEQHQIPLFSGFPLGHGSVNQLVPLNRICRIGVSEKKAVFWNHCDKMAFI